MPFPSPGDHPDPGIKPVFLCLLHWQVDSLPLCHLGSPYTLVFMFLGYTSPLAACGEKAPPSVPLVTSVQSLSRVQLFVTPWTAARQASLSITNSRSLLKLMSTESVMSSNHLILCCPLLPPSIFPSIRVFTNESFLHIRWPRYWSFSNQAFQ